MSKDTPAFPHVQPRDPAFEHMVSGLTKRQWYAGMALQGLLSGSPDSDCGPAGYAHDAFALADAMIAHEESE